MVLGCPSPPGLRCPHSQTGGGKEVQGPLAVTCRGGGKAKRAGESSEGRWVWSPRVPPTGPEAAADAGGGGSQGRGPGETAGGGPLREPGRRADPPGQAARRHQEAAAGQRHGRWPPGSPGQGLPPGRQPGAGAGPGRGRQAGGGGPAGPAVVHALPGPGAPGTEPHGLPRAAQLPHQRSVSSVASGRLLSQLCHPPGAVTHTPEGLMTLGLGLGLGIQRSGAWEQIQQERSRGLNPVPPPSSPRLGTAERKGDRAPACLSPHPHHALSVVTVLQAQRAPRVTLGSRVPAPPAGPARRSDGPRLPRETAAQRGPWPW